MDEQLEEIAKKVAELRVLDVTHNELGSANGFHEAQANKTEFCSYIDGLLALLRRQSQALPQKGLTTGIQQINSAVTAVTSQVTAIDALVAKGTNQQNFPNHRKSHIDSILAQRNNLETQLFSIVTAMRLADVEGATSGDGRLQQIIESASERLSALESKSRQADQIVAAMRDDATKSSVSDAAGTFSVLRDNHRDREQYWFIAFIVFAVCSVSALAWVAFSPFDVAEPISAVASLVRRLLVVSTPAIFMKVSLNKYNLERNLRIVYDHRETVLGAYPKFEAGLPDDADTRHKLRMEIAKLIFDDPMTGYVNPDGGGEVNINPVISTVEKLAGGAT